MPRRSNHSSSGTSAIATTSAAVTGMKNSAPARSANGKPTISADAGDQGQRGEQPVALDGDGLGEHPRFVVDVVLGLLLMLAGCARP